jgi:choline-sulfatase
VRDAIITPVLTQLFRGLRLRRPGRVRTESRRNRTAPAAQAVRRAQVTLLVLGVLGLTLPTSILGADPNVLLFTVDSCRADRFGVYGGDPEITPNIDRWSRTGAVFSQAYSVSVWTAPGLASLLTGLYPPVHGINNRDRMGPEELVTLPRIFRELGYRVPNLNFFTFAPYYLNLGLGPIDRSYFGPDESSAVLNWLDRPAEDDGGRPFFLWFHTTIVHQPYRPPAGLLPAPREELEQSPGLKAVLNGAIVPQGSAEFEPSDRPLLDELYNAEVHLMDELFGQVLEHLQNRDLLDSTVIVLTADHGEELLDHGFVGHASTSLQAKLYEELVRIPLIVSWPGRIPAGTVWSHPVSQIDVLPTILNLLRQPVPKGVQGQDLFNPDFDRPLYFESVAAGNQTPRERENEWVRGIRHGRFKYLSDGRLFDLLTDSTETRDISIDEPETTQELKSRLESWVEQSRTVARELFGTDTDGRVRRRDTGECPRIYTPEHGKQLSYDVHTGALLFDWRGDMDTTYIIEYDIGEGDHHVAGRYEVEGNHQILGPLPYELWQDLKAWNPFRIRVTPKGDPACWSDWVRFEF